VKFDYEKVTLLLDQLEKGLENLKFLNEGLVFGTEKIKEKLEDAA